VFVRHGYWLLGWEADEQPVQVKRRDQIQPGDRIAIKKRSRGNLSSIEIRALGTVTGVDPDSRHVYVRWVESELNHQVEGRGCYASIHGPFFADDEWVRRMFLLDRLEYGLYETELPDLNDVTELSPEGAKRWRWHVRAERNRTLVARKKARVRADKGCLTCEACTLDFAKVYGRLGSDFCEVHHLLPVAELEGPVCPRLEDLAILCSNCHRMIHRTRPFETVEDFREHVKGFQQLVSNWQGASPCG
jgi:hypothetical protein